jgi:uncharacterized membrane protein YeaQ/YmgE (transglycosylase-associated protein family)
MADRTLALGSFNIDSGGLFGSIIFWLLAGMIAGTVANFVVRGRAGCLFGNFFLGIIGAIIAYFLLNLVPGIKWQAQFLGATLIASVGATLIAFIFHQARRAENRYQARLLDRSKTEGT